MHEAFRRFAQTAAQLVGSAWAFILAAVVIVVWAITGPVFGFSDTWQLVINTGTTIVTFLMVFLIQNTQNRDAKSLHLKLDELIRGVHGARTGLVALEELSDSELDDLQHQFDRLRKRKSASIQLPPHEAEQAEKAVATAKRKRGRNGNRNVAKGK
jgi:low affinity Fe/Cu permease